MKSQEFAQHIERMKSVFNNSEGVTLEDYKIWVAMLDMFLKLKIEMENFEINTIIEQQAEDEKKKTRDEMVGRFNLGDMVAKLVESTNDTLRNIDAMKQRDLSIQNDNGLTEEQEISSSLDEDELKAITDPDYYDHGDLGPNKEEMEDNNEQ
jgi:hypothetical protein